MCFPIFDKCLHELKVLHILYSNLYDYGLTSAFVSKSVCSYACVSEPCRRVSADICFCVCNLCVSMLICVFVCVCMNAQAQMCHVMVMFFASYPTVHFVTRKRLYLQKIACMHEFWVYQDLLACNNLKSHRVWILVTIASSCTVEDALMSLSRTVSEREQLDNNDCPLFTNPSLAFTPTDPNWGLMGAH